MQLNNTTILPADSPATAEKLFKSLIQEQDVICLIVFGNDSVAEQAIQSADVRAAVAPAGFKRRAVWMTDSSLWTNLKGYVKDGSIKVADVNPDNLIALGISLTDKAASSVDKSKTPDFIVMELAFVQASKL